MVNVSRPVKCRGCGKNIRIMHTGTGRRVVDESIFRVLRTGSKYADEFYNQSGNPIRGNIMVPGDRWYDESEPAYRPHRCSGILRKRKKMVRVPADKTA